MHTAPSPCPGPMAGIGIAHSRLAYQLVLALFPPPFCILPQAQSKAAEEAPCCFGCCKL